MEQSPPVAFGDLLRAFRQARGYSQRSLARLSGLDSTYVSRLESGAYKPPKVPTVHQLAAALELDSEDEAALIEASGRLPAGMRVVARLEQPSTGGQRAKDAYQGSGSKRRARTRRTGAPARIDPEVFAFQEIRDAVGEAFPDDDLRQLMEAVLVARGQVVESGSDGLDFVALRRRDSESSVITYVFVRAGREADLATVHNFLRAADLCRADRGILVCWHGFTSHALAQLRRLSWVNPLDADGVTRAALDEYERLPEDVRSRLPLKRVWVLDRH